MAEVGVEKVIGFFVCFFVFFKQFSLPSQDTFQLNILCLARGIRGDSTNTGDFFKIISTRYFFSFFLSFFFFSGHALWDFTFQSETEPGPLAVRAWSPNHWTTREFPKLYFLRLNMSDSELPQT